MYYTGTEGRDGRKVEGGVRLRNSALLNILLLGLAHVDVRGVRWHGRVMFKIFPTRWNEPNIGKVVVLKAHESGVSPLQ